MSALEHIEVVLVEDDAALAQATIQALEMEGAQVAHFDRAAPCLEHVGRDYAGVVVSDVRLPGSDGIDLFKQLHELDPGLPVILVTGHGDITMAVDALREGAFDFLAKPFATERLVASVLKASRKRALELENRALRAALERNHAHAIPDNSPAGKHLRKLVEAVAQADVDVAIEGEAGTGKTFIARLLHDLGQRKSRPFVTVDPGIVHHPDAELLLFGRDPAAGLSHTGLIERARGGTLFLDEIDDMPDPMRQRLQSFLETRLVYPLGADRPRAVDIRVIGATCIEGGIARGSLLDRISPIRIELPPLKDRREDIGEFLALFIGKYEAQLGRELDAPDGWGLALAGWADWEGNLRELDAFAKSTVLGLTEIGDLAAPDQSQQGLRERLAAYEKAVLEDTLRSHAGDVAKTCRALELPRKTVYDKLARYGLKPKDFRR